MERLLESYIHWALRDADLQNRTRMIPTYVVKARCKNASTDSTVQSIVRGLIGLANRYRRVWRQRCSGEPASEDTSSFAGQRRERFDDSRFPILTGFLICGPALGIITLDSNPVKTPVLDPESSARLIAQFNFSEPSQDVWNALAVAIVVIQVRKMILQVLQENAEGLMWETDGSNTKTGVDEDA